MATPTIRRAAGFTLFELLVVVCLVGLLAAVVLDRMVRYQEIAEKVAMEQTVAALRSAQVLNVAARIVTGGLANAARLEDENPMTWLAEPPGNYAGAYYDPPPEQVQRGSWYYDLKSKELIYKPKSTRFLESAGAEADRIRFRAVVRVSAGGGASGVPELSELGVRPVHPVRWYPEF